MNFMGMSDDRLLTSLDALLGNAIREFSYLYDFGDSWIHTIVVEKAVAVPLKDRDPVCLAGARACPPEDCGGPGGYPELLEALADKNHPEHEDKMEWIGPFDAAAFNVDAATAAMRKAR